MEVLAERGYHVTAFDNFSVGREEFLSKAQASGRLSIVRGDALDLDALTEASKGHNVIVHLAANPEARWGLERTRLDLEQGTIATYNSLEAARLNGIADFVFSSSGTVYGNTAKACAETELGELPISLYGASKFAGEALVSSYVECFKIRGTICRFGNVVGPRGTHGAILDFLKKLKAHPEYLDVLGNGTQSKPYLHVTDCVAGLVHALDHGPDALNVYNLGPKDFTSVKKIAELCVAASPRVGKRSPLPTRRLDGKTWAADTFGVPRAACSAGEPRGEPRPARHFRPNLEGRTHVPRCDANYATSPSSSLRSTMLCQYGGAPWRRPRGRASRSSKGGPVSSSTLLT